MNASPGSILLIVAVVCFLLVAFGVSLGTVNLIGIGLAAFAVPLLGRFILRTYEPPTEPAQPA